MTFEFYLTRSVYVKIYNRKTFLRLTSGNNMAVPVLILTSVDIYHRGEKVVPTSQSISTSPVSNIYLQKQVRHELAKTISYLANTSPHFTNESRSSFPTVFQPKVLHPRSDLSRVRLSLAHSDLWNSWKSILLFSSFYSLTIFTTEQLDQPKS